MNISISKNNIQHLATQTKEIPHIIECSVSDISENAAPEISNKEINHLLMHAQIRISEIESP